MEDKGFKEFRGEILRRGHSLGKVRQSWGIYDSYKHIRKNKWYNIGRPLKEGEFYSIIRTVNNKFAEEISQGHTVTFPQHMGKIELRKYRCKAFFSNDKLKVSYPIDWDETLKLWYRDPKAREQKTLLRNENPWAYYLYYNKKDANYNNKVFYQFAVNTFAKQHLSKNLRKGKADSIWN